jgi:hypothetical protein
VLSLASVIVNLLRDPGLIQIRRLPPIKYLRVRQLATALAFFSVLTATTLRFPESFTNLEWHVPCALLGAFAAGSWLGGPFAVLTGLLYALPTPTLPFATVWVAFLALAKIYFAAYVFGAVFASLYNDALFIYVVVLQRKSSRIAFAFDTSKVINIIKSPKHEEEAAFRKLFLAHPDLEAQKLYPDEWEHPPQFPYTILLVANPKIRKRRLQPTDPEFEIDPIIQDRDLFLSSVDRALKSFEKDEVLGCAEVWSRVRIVVIFDPKLDIALAQEFQDDMTIDGKVAENLLDTTDNMPERIGNLLQQHPVGSPSPLTLCDVDVIYVMSASPSHDRSTTRYSDYLETGEHFTCSRTTAQPFQFDPDPLGLKKDSHGLPEINAARCSDPGVRCEHDDFSRSPGRVALNVLGARQKTFIHEFAHAMSSASTGTITDEYADVYILQGAKAEPSLPQAPFYVNRIERVPQSNGHFIAAHKLFARYKHVDFYTDLAHPSAEADWLGYFPECHDSACECTMDRTGADYRFDKLISNFMYDRLCAKLNRPH